MKLTEEVKDKIDEYFNNITAEELYEIAVEKYGLKEKDLVGDIEGFPIEVVQWLVDEQVRQGNSANASVFQRDIYADKVRGGIDWDECPEEEEEDDFCVKVLDYKNFDVFFDKYPKDEEEKSAPPKHETTIYDLDLHESLYLSNLNTAVVRVAGGWIYNYWCVETDKALGGVFVRYDNEFQK